ncbi:MAG: FecR family protein [Bacteriovoracaceae bacterium]
MIKSRLLLIFISLISFQTSVAETSSVGVVLLIKGEVIMEKEDGLESYLKKGDSVFDKSTLKTLDQSFVRIVFDDRSSLNLAANSQLQINNYPKNRAGILSLVKGKIRTLVKKDYLKWRRDKNKSKLFIKTENAALGVRGTDFIVNFDTSTKKTELDVISGEVAMIHAQKVNMKDIKSAALDRMLLEKSAVLVKPGMRSSVINRRIPPSKPTKIPRKILNQLQVRKMDFIKRDAHKDNGNIKKERSKKRPHQFKKNKNGAEEALEFNPLDKNKLNEKKFNKNRPKLERHQFKHLKRLPRPVAPRPTLQSTPIKTDTYTAPLDIKR